MITLTPTATVYLDNYQLERQRETAALQAEIAALRARVQQLTETQLKLCKVLHLVSQRALQLTKERATLPVHFVE